MLPVFLSYQHGDHERALRCELSIRRTMVGLVRVLRSDPQRLFDAPIEAVPERITEARVIVQLMPPGGETPWMAAERSFAEELGVPVIRTDQPRLKPAQRRRLWRSVFTRSSYTPYAKYFGETFRATETLPTPYRLLPHGPWRYARWLAFAALTVWSKSVTVSVLCAWVEKFLIDSLRREHAVEPPVLHQWQTAHQKAFHDLREYGEHEKRIDDDLGWAGMGVDLSFLGLSLLAALVLVSVGAAIVVDVVLWLVFWRHL